MSNPTRPTSLADALDALRDHTARYFLATLPQRRSQQAAGAPSASTRAQTLADAAKVRTERRKATAKAAETAEDALYTKAWGAPTPDAPKAATPRPTPTTDAPSTTDADALYRKAWPDPPAPDKLR